MNIFFDSSDIQLDQFKQLCTRSASVKEYPHATRVERNVVIYEGSALRSIMEDREGESMLLMELNRCLSSGPGVFVIRDMYEDQSVIDASTELFEIIIAEEKEHGYGRGDHFGENERIWNSFQKIGLKNPTSFVHYYGNPLLGLVARAWLGPFYQITAQVNNVKPGSKAQSPHRDYHLGFQAQEDIARFPAQTQVMSQYLTLQGAVAHSDMPLESGPTLLLPFSQQYPPGYLAYGLPEFVAFFNANCVQVPLDKGDGLFFSPALFHGAGTNQGASDRMANLLQISSAFGRPMESVDTSKIINAIYPVLLNWKQAHRLEDRLVQDILAAIADGYSFPTNLDTDPPKGGRAPMSQGALVLQALSNHWTPQQLSTALLNHATRKKA